MARQLPYTIEGTITFKGSATAGLMVWVWDKTKIKSMGNMLQNTTFVKTDTSGDYNICLSDVARTQSFTFADADKLRVYAMGIDHDILTFSDVTVSMKAGYNTVNFALTDKSALVDGLKSEPTTLANETRAARGLDKGMERGTVDGMQ